MTTDNALVSLAKAITGQAKVSPTKTEGESGAYEVGGYLVEVENDPSLYGTKKFETYSNVLANVSIAAASVRYYLNLVANAEWRVEPAEEPGAEKYADLVEEMMGDMNRPWRKIVRRASMYRFHGFSIQEWTAKKRDDGIIGMADIAPRPQISIERWDLERDGTVNGVFQRSNYTAAHTWLPRGKLVYIVDDALNDTPEGLGLFRHIIAAANRLKVYEALEGVGFEADLRGIPIGRAPIGDLNKAIRDGNLSEAQKTTLMAPITNFVSKRIKNASLGMVLDSTVYKTTDERGAPSSQLKWDVELLQHQSTTQSEINIALERIAREIARPMGTEMLLLGSSSVGSHALSEDKTSAFNLGVDTALAEVGDSFNKDFIDPIWELNGWPPEMKPTIKPERIKSKDAEKVSRTLSNMASAGAQLMPDDPAINDVRDMLGVNAVDLDAIDLDLLVRDRTGGEPKKGEIPEKGE